MAVAFDSAYSGNAGASKTSSMTIANVAVGNNDNRILILGVAWDGADTTTTISAVFQAAGGDQSFTSFHGPILNSAGAQAKVELLYLLAPDVETANVVVTFNTEDTIGAAGIISLYNVDQTTPLDSAQDDDGGDISVAQVTVSVATSADDLVVGVGCKSNNTETFDTDVGTERYNDESSNATASSNRMAIGATATDASSATVTFGSGGGTRPMAMIGVNVNQFVAAAVGGTALTGGTMTGGTLQNIIGAHPILSPLAYGFYRFLRRRQRLMASHKKWRL
jgi:hypothetical protein